jgi:hypothetical protein
VIVSLWVGHTPRSLALAHVVRETIAALGWKESYFAALMKIAPSRASRQLAGVEPLNLWRLAELPDAFQVEYDRRRAAMRGAVVLEPPDLSLVRGFCAMDSREMQKMTTPIEAAERKFA